MNIILYTLLEAIVLLTVYVLGELFSHYVLFKLLNDRYMSERNPPKPPEEKQSGEQSEGSSQSRAQIKGHFERGMLVLGLAAGFPQILIAFGALKIGTFFKDQDNAKISNDYYLIGNVVSISIAIIYTILWRVSMNGIEALLS